MNSTSNNAPWVVVAAGFHSLGGMDKANLALAQYLLDQDVPVHVVAHKVDAELERHPLARIHMVHPPAGMLSLGEPLLDWQGRRVARSVLSRWPNAQVVVNGGNCIWPGINWVHYVHHAWHPAVSGGSAAHRIKDELFNVWARKRERAAFKKARLVITNARATTRDVVEKVQIDERKVHTIYLGSDPEWGLVTPEERRAGRRALQVTDSRPLAVFVGALGFDHRKGFDVLFDAWQRLCARPDWDADLLVAGTGRALAMWQAKVSEAGLANRIRLLGFSNQVKHLLAAADLLVSPVRYEPYGLNVQEAICRGIPAVVSSSAGVAERYSGELAPLLLPDPEDVTDLVERLLGWRAGVDYWKTKFQLLGEELRRNTWPKMAEQIVALAGRVAGYGEPNRLELVGPETGGHLL